MIFRPWYRRSSKRFFQKYFLIKSISEKIGHPGAMYVERALHDLDSLSTDFSYLLIIILIKKCVWDCSSYNEFKLLYIVLDFENS